MQVNRERPQALAKLMGHLVDRKKSHDMQLIGMMREKIKQERIQSIAQNYLNNFQRPGGSLSQQLASGTQSAFDLMQYGDDAKPAIDMIRNNNSILGRQKSNQEKSPSTLFEHVFKSNFSPESIEQARQFTSATTKPEKAEKKNLTFLRGSNVVDGVEQESATVIDEANPTVPIGKIDLGKKPVKDTEGDREKKEAKTQIKRLTDENIEFGSEIQMLDSQYQFTQDGEGNITSAKYVDPSKNKLIDIDDEDQMKDIYMRYNGEKQKLLNAIKVNEKRLVEYNKLIGGTFNPKAAGKGPVQKSINGKSYTVRRKN